MLVRCVIVLVVVTAASAVAQPADPQPRRRGLATRSLARCCGKQRATLGPLFGKLALGPLTGRLGDTIFEGGVPAHLQPARTGLTITFMIGEGPDDMHLDGVAIEVPDRDLCVQLEKRLAKRWGRAPWVNPARHRSATLAWGTGTDAATCTLRFTRLPTADATRCRADETPNLTWEIDITRRCLRPAPPRGCRFERVLTSVGQHRHCSVDQHHRFWMTTAPSDDRACTPDELDGVDLLALRECTSATSP